MLPVHRCSRTGMTIGDMLEGYWGICQGWAPHVMTVAAGSEAKAGRRHVAVSGNQGCDRLGPQARHVNALPEDIRLLTGCWLFSWGTLEAQVVAQKEVCEGLLQGVARV